MLNPRWIYCFFDFETTGLDPRIAKPIEVACIWVDHKLRLLGSFQSLIRPDDRMKGWESPDELAAYAVHHIEASEAYEAHGPAVVCQHIARMNTKIRKQQKGLDKRKTILVSDNAYFDTSFMRQLFPPTENGWPFHYCTWDTSLLLEMTGVGDPQDTEHRAMSDAAGLLESVREAYFIVLTGEFALERPTVASDAE